MSLVDRIRNLCGSRNTTLIGLEREIELGRGTIRKWDDYSPSVDKLQKVADYFNVSTDYLLYGFDRNTLTQFVNSIKDGRSLDKFSEDTNIDINVLTKICLGLISERPSLDVLEKIAAHNPIDFIIDRLILLKAGGYPELVSIEEDFKDESFEDNYTPTTIAAHHDGDEWTEEELTVIEDFKEFVRSKRNAKS